MVCLDQLATQPWVTADFTDVQNKLALKCHLHPPQGG